MKQSQEINRHVFSICGTLLGALIIGACLVKPAAADTWAWVFKSNGGNATSGSSASGSGVAFATPAQPSHMPSPGANSGGSWSGAAIAGSNSASAAQASASGSASGSLTGQWEDITPGGSGMPFVPPTTGLEFTSYELVMATAMAAASYTTDSQTGAIKHAGMASATATPGDDADSNMGSEGAIGFGINASDKLDGTLQVDSPTPDPQGVALSMSPYYASPFHSGYVYNYTDLGTQGRGGASIFQNGTLVWGSGVAGGIIVVTQIVDISADTMGGTQAGFDSGSSLGLSASSTTTAQGSAAVASGVILVRTTVAPH